MVMRIMCGGRLIFLGKVVVTDRDMYPSLCQWLTARKSGISMSGTFKDSIVRCLDLGHDVQDRRLQ